VIAQTVSNNIIKVYKHSSAWRSWSKKNCTASMAGHRSFIRWRKGNTDNKLLSQIVFTSVAECISM